MRTAAETVIYKCRRLLGAIGGLIRWDEWYDSKVPLFFVSFYHLCLVETLPVGQVIPRFALVTSFACLYLAFGYLINDYADRESDHIAGKKKLIASLPDSTAIVLLCMLGLAGMTVPLTVISNHVVAVGLTGVVYFFAVFYSMPPIRFKERGVWGLIVSAVAQRSLPSLFVFAIFAHYEVDTWLLFLLFGLIGVRWILVHQLIDLQNDLDAGISTFATHVGRQTSQRLTKWVVFPLELACLAAMWAYEMVRFPSLWIVPLGYAVVVATNWFLWKEVDWPYRFASFARQPLSDLYYLYWPMSLALTIAVRQPIFWPILVLNVLWQGSYLRRHGRTAFRLLQLRLGMVERPAQ